VVVEARGLSHDQKLVSDGFQAHSLVSMVYISDQILRLFGIGVSLNTLSRLIRHPPDVKTVDWIPMERARVMADPAAIDAYYAKIAELIDDVPREFVLNMDETGFADHLDAREERIMVPATYLHATIPLPVDCNMKRSTMVAGVAADGAALKPMIIVPRVTIERELLLWGYGSGKVFFKFQENRFIAIPRFGE
jgi:hypothetical protein